MSLAAATMLPSRRFHLRQMTAREHHMLDGMVGPFTDIAAYRRYLAGIAAFRQSVEPVLDGWSLPDEWDGYAPVQVRAALSADLVSLGLPAPETDGDFAPGNDRSAMLGVFYTLEGSNIGARLLLRRAAELGLTDGHGASHLALQAAGGGQWQRFVDILENAADVDEGRMGEAALATFAIARQSFERSRREWH